jgi:hypothetical protein
MEFQRSQHIVKLKITVTSTGVKTLHPPLMHHHNPKKNDRLGKETPLKSSILCTFMKQILWEMQLRYCFENSGKQKSADNPPEDSPRTANTRMKNPGHFL